MGEGLSAGAGSGAGLCPMLQGEGHETGPPLQGPATLVCVLRRSEPGPVPATCAGGLVPGLPLPSHGGDRGSPHSRGRGFAPKPVSPPGPSAILCFHTWRRQDWTSGFSSSGPAPTRPRGADKGLPPAPAMLRAVRVVTVGQTPEPPRTPAWDTCWRRQEAWIRPLHAHGNPSHHRPRSPGFYVAMKGLHAPGDPALPRFAF